MTNSTFLILCTDLLVAHIDCKTLMQLVAAGNLDQVTGPSPQGNETYSEPIVLNEQQ